MEEDKDTTRDYRTDWQAFAADKIPTKGIEIPSLEKFLSAHPPKLDQGNKRRLLDLGCGSGALSHELVVGGYEVFGVDINESAIASAKKLYGKEGMPVSFFTADTTSTEGLNLQAPFHLVVCQLVISVVGGKPERRQLLANAFNTLLPGGSLYLSASGVSDAINEEYAKLYAQDGPLTGEDYTYYSRDVSGTILYETHHFSTHELQSLLEEAGFEEIAIETSREASSRRPDQAAYFHYATALKKKV